MSVDVTELPTSPVTPVREDEEFPVEPVTNPSPVDEIDRIIPDPFKPFELADGTTVVAKPLKLRELLAALKVVTRGAALSLGTIRFDLNDEAFVQSMIGLFLFAVPEAEDEVTDFIRVMVDPVGPFAGREEREAAEAKLDDVLENPDLEDVLLIIETVIRRESKDLRSLGKRLENMMKIAQKTGQITA